MKKILFTLCVLVYAWSAAAQSVDGYHPLDPSNPIVFGGDHLRYHDRTIELGKNAFFLDGSLPDAVADRYPYVFNNFQAAVAALSDGTESQPMVIYMAPWVYWVDDPDDPAVRKPKPGDSAPFGMEIACEWLRFEGLSPDPANVVMASNRGQTHGAEGNFTMFNFKGNGLSAENVTFGNYCNIDLEFPLEPELSRRRRADAIVQAQLAFTDADRAWAKNSRFVSRLNLCPFTGGKRVFFYGCHFESTDDALCGTAVYLDCHFDFYGNKPFGSTSGTGAVMLDCDFNSHITDPWQYMTKRHSPLALVDCRYHHASDDLLFGWSGDPRDYIQNNQYNVTLNGKPVLFNATDRPWLTVDMTGKPLLNAYRIDYNGTVIYNTYNLLRGNDDWDPMGVKETIIAAGNAAGTDYTNLPVYLHVKPETGYLETGVNRTDLSAELLRWGNYAAVKSPLSWYVALEDSDRAALQPTADTYGCEVTGINDHDDTRPVLIYVTTPSGLRSASVQTIAPAYLDAPTFTKLPRIITTANGAMLAVEYGLDLGNYLDESLITWYRWTDKGGSDAIEVAVSRLNRPEYTYTLTPGDADHFILAKVEPRHLRSHPGEALTAITPDEISPEAVGNPRSFSTDFRTFPSAYQPRILPGTWTVDNFKPVDTEYYDWDLSPGKESWYYGTAQDNAHGMGFVQAVRGARLLYTPVEGTYGDMSVTLAVDPCKVGGQGFGSATGQYLDIFIQYDTKTLSGYGLRIIRTTKHDNAVDFILMKYENGRSQELTAPVSSTAYRSTCTIRLEVRGNKLSASAATTAPDSARPGQAVVPSVHIETEIVPNGFGGAGVVHTGSVGANSTMLHQMDILWK